MRMIRCKVVIAMPAAALRQVFTRRKARTWCYNKGFSHIFNEPCAHPECQKTRNYFRRGILYKTEYNAIQYAVIGHYVSEETKAARIAANKQLITVAK